MAKSKVTYKSNVKEMKKLMEEANHAALLMIGEFIISIIVLTMTRLKIVDTGRLRASISYVVGKYSSFGKTKTIAGKPNAEDRPEGIGKEDRIIIGTNVRYAARQEDLRPYMRPSVVRNIAKIRELYHDVYERKMKGG
jgi:hypothetical protein